MPAHRQVRLEAPGIAFEVDEAIAPLINALWQRGYRTTGSCQHLPNTEVAYIGFESEDQAKEFADHIGGMVVRPDRGLDSAPPDDPLWDTVAVTFPADSIERVLALVEGVG